MEISSVNNATIVGRVGSKKIKELKNTKVANLSVATTQSKKSKSGYDNFTTWHQIRIWGGAAKFVENNVFKGDMVAVTGSIQVNKWEDDNGNQKQNHFIYANKFTKLFGTSKNDSETETNNDNNDNEIEQDEKTEEDEEVPF